MSNMVKPRAFTLIELLVVIAIIALLMAILMPALQRVKEQGKKVVCSNNLRQISLSLNMYGSDNDGKLPLNQSGWWLWDIAYSTSDYIIASGGDRKTFYCPSDRLKTPDMACLWQFSQDIPFGTRHGVVPEPTTNRGSYYRVTSYFWMMDTVDGRSNQPEGIPKKVWVKMLTCKQPAATDLVTDATLSDGSDAKTASFTEVEGGSWYRWQLYDSTNHLTHGDRPVGSNILFVDGHLEWRPFKDMDIRVGPPYPYHWW